MEGTTVQDIHHIWRRFNRRWLLVGGFSGVGAGVVMLLVASTAALAIGREFAFPLRLVGASILGPQAMQIGSILGGLFGFFVHFGLSCFFGLVFAQFVCESSRKRILFSLSLLAALCVWLFWSMMFMPSLNEPMTFLLPKMVSLGFHLVFGLTFGLLLVLFRPFAFRKF